MSNNNNSKNTKSNMKKSVYLLTLLRHNNKKEAKEFLSSGILDINAVIDYTGKTVLMDIVDFHNKDGVELLLEMGANVNIKDKKGKTALSYALEDDNKDIVELLLKHGAKRSNNNNNNNKMNNNTRRKFMNRMTPSLRKINLSNTKKIRKEQKN